MRLLHPFMPFLTEEIWQHLPHEGESITISSWPVPVPEHTDQEAAADMKLLVELIRSVRNIRSEVNTPMSKQVELYIKHLRKTLPAALRRTVLTLSVSRIRAR